MTISYMSIRYFDNICHSSPPSVLLSSLGNASPQKFPSSFLVSLGEELEPPASALLGSFSRKRRHCTSGYTAEVFWLHLLQQATVANSASATNKIFHDFGWNKFMEFVSNPFITAKNKCGHHLFRNFISIINYHFNVLIILRDIKWILIGGICKIWILYSLTFSL